MEKIEIRRMILVGSANSGCMGEIEGTNNIKGATIITTGTLSLDQNLWTMLQSRSFVEFLYP